MTTNSLNMARATRASTIEHKDWQWLYKMGAITAFISLLIIPTSIVAFILWPPPQSVLGHFEQFQANSLIGLIGMDLLYLVTNLIIIPTWLAMYVALRRTNESLTAVALAFGFIGIIALIISRPLVEMHTLSTQYALATNEMEQTIPLAAGEAMMALYRGTAFNIHYLLGTLGLLIFAFVMLPSDRFSRRTAYVGIIANLLALGFYLPIIGIAVSIFSVIFYWIWYFLIARQLWPLGKA